MFLWCFSYFSNTVLSWLISCSYQNPQQMNQAYANLDPSSWPWYYTLLWLLPPFVQILFFWGFSNNVRDRYSILLRPYLSYTPNRFFVFIVFVSQFLAGFQSVILVVPASAPGGLSATHYAAGGMVILVILLHLGGTIVLGTCYSDSLSCRCRPGSSCFNNRGRSGNFSRHGFNFLVLAIFAGTIWVFQFATLVGGALWINQAFVFGSGVPLIVTSYSIWNIIVLWNRNGNRTCNKVGINGSQPNSGLGYGNGGCDDGFVGSGYGGGGGCGGGGRWD